MSEHDVAAPCAAHGAGNNEHSGGSPPSQSLRASRRQFIKGVIVAISRNDQMAGLSLLEKMDPPGRMDVTRQTRPIVISLTLLASAAAAIQDHVPASPRG